MSARSALLLGATGLVGGHALAALARDPRWSRVVTLGRRAMPTASPTHTHHVVDFDRLDAVADRFACDDLLCALGTTIKAAGSPEAFRRVDLEIPAQAARLAADAGATQAVLVTAWGADPDSRMLYTRTKGEAERAVADAGFDAVQILRPSLLAGDRDEFRLGERVGLAVGRVVAPLLRGPLAPLRPIPADAVGRAMVEIAGRRSGGVRAYGPGAIRAWAEKG